MPITGGTGGGGGATDHGALTGLADDDHLQYLLLAGRTGGQVVGVGAHTGGNTFDLTFEGRLQLGDALTGVNFISGRVLDIRFNTTNGGTGVNIQPNLTSLSGTASGVINSVLINATGTYGYSAGSFQHRAFFFNGNVTVPNGVTLTFLTAGNFQCVTNEIAGGSGVINNVTGLSVDARLPINVAAGHTATSLIGLDVRINSRTKDVTNVYSIFLGASAGSVSGAVANFAGIEFSNVLQSGTTVSNWSAIRMLNMLSPVPVTSWFFNILPDELNSRHAGKFSIGHINTPGAWVDIGPSASAQASARIRSGTAPTSPNDGDMWNDSTRQALQGRLAGITQSLEGVVFTQTADQTIANTTTETTLYASGIGTLTFPANFWTPGKTVVLELWGHYSTQAGAGAVQNRVTLGGTAILDSGSVSISSSQTTELWTARIILTCRTTGATGTIIGQGVFERAINSSPNIVWRDLVNTTTTVIDTTAALALDVTWKWDTASAGNTVTCTHATVEVRN